MAFPPNIVGVRGPIQHYRMPILVGLGLNAVANPGGAYYKLSDEGRQPLQESYDERNVVVQLASGYERRYIKARKRKFSLSWENLTQSSNTTIDGGQGRDFIRAIVYQPGPLLFVIDDGLNPLERYYVWVDSYQDNVQMRRPSGNFYNVTLQLKEA